MTDANYMQQRMAELQRNDAVQDIFSKIVSGKSGYKAPIVKKEIIIRCKNCMMQLETFHKFCFECGMKAEKPEEQ